MKSFSSFSEFKSVLPRHQNEAPQLPPNKLVTKRGVSEEERKELQVEACWEEAEKEGRKELEEIRKREEEAKRRAKEGREQQKEEAMRRRVETARRRLEEAERLFRRELMRGIVPKRVAALRSEVAWAARGTGEFVRVF